MLASEQTTQVEPSTSTGMLPIQTMAQQEKKIQKEQSEQLKEITPRKFCNRNNETNRLIEIFRNIKGLNDTQQKSLEYRYIRMLSEFSNRCIRYSVLFHLGHFIITVGSLIVPALISVQYADSNISAFTSPQLQAQIYWITWTLSLLVTTFNGVLVLYKVDKKYYFLHTTRERLRSEGWQYIQLTGRYSGILMDFKTHATHSNQLVAFCYYIERIRMRQIEEEYYKFEEAQQPEVSKNGQATKTNNQSVSNTVTIDVKDFFTNVEKNKESIKNQPPEEMFKSILGSLILSSHDKTKSGSSKLTHSQNNNTATSESNKPSNQVIEPGQNEDNSSSTT